MHRLLAMHHSGMPENTSNHVILVLSVGKKTRKNG